MNPLEATLTRRQLLARAGATAAGLAVSGSLVDVLARSLAAGAPVPPAVPRFRSRPDLRIPALSVARDDELASPEPIFIAPYNAPDGQAGALIAARSGEPIWENPLEDLVTMNFRVQSYRGSPVLTWWEGEIELGHGVGEYVIADAAYRTVRRVRAAGHLRGDLHEFLITPRGTALLTSYVVTGADLRTVGGPRDGTIQDAIFQEVDIATGRLLLEWHSLEHIPLAESYAPVTADWDFFHINSIAPDHDGSLLISARSTHTVYKIARDGAVVWRLGGRGSDFQMGPGATFAWQHDARRQPEGTLSVFDNGATPAVERRSRALVLALDEQALRASLLHEYSHAGVLAGSQGSVQLLENDNVFVGWGEVPRVSEFLPTGELVYDALLGRGYECYRAFRSPWSGQPADTPALALDVPARVAYASWNGATEVAAWELRAGSAGAMRALGRTPARGFETSIALPRGVRRVEVDALAQDGRTLGGSGPVTA